MMAGVLMATASAAQTPAAGPPPSSAPAAVAVPDPLDALKRRPVDLYQSPDGSDRFKHGALYPPPPISYPPPIFVPGAYYYPPYWFETRDDSERRLYRLNRQATRQRDYARGHLAIDALPDGAQVYVDGFYVGLAEEFGARGRPLELSAGAHHVELRAGGFEPLSFSVWIEPGEIVRYRGDMQRLPRSTPGAVSATPSRPAAAAKSLYVIPNCYAGDRPPVGPLPKGCDRKNLQTRQ